MGTLKFIIKPSRGKTGTQFTVTQIGINGEPLNSSERETSWANCQKNIKAVIMGTNAIPGTKFHVEDLSRQQNITYVVRSWDPKPVIEFEIPFIPFTAKQIKKHGLRANPGKN